MHSFDVDEFQMSSNNNLPWLENLHLKFDNMQNFEKPTGSIANFTIHHFAQSVQYDATDFLSKNCESVIKEQLEVLRETKVCCLKCLSKKSLMYFILF